MVGHLALGVVHPKGESSEYDGLFFKENEMCKLAEDLVGKPILFEHDSDKVVGKIIHAFVGQGVEEGELFCLFEMDKTFEGEMASAFLEGGIAADLSLGHDVQIRESETSSEVVGKIPVEVSLCTKGARENTHVYLYANSTEKKYIKKCRSSSKQSASVEIMDSVQNTNTMPTTENPDSTGVEQKVANTFLNEMKSLKTAGNDTSAALQRVIEEKEKMARELETLKSERDQMNQAGQRKRANVVNGSVAELYKLLLERHQETLGDGGEDWKETTQGMIQNPAASHLVEVLNCCAKEFNKSTTKLEAQYQENKRLKEEMASIQKTLAPAFSSKSERIISRRAEASASTTEQPPPKKAKYNFYGYNPQTKNPKLWDQVNSYSGSMNEFSKTFSKPY